MKVAVVHGEVPPDAPPDEQDVLVQADTLSQTMRELGHETRTTSFGLQVQDFIDDLRGWTPDLIFNLVETVAGTARLSHLAPSVFDWMGIPYTGAPTHALYLTSHKILGKQALRAAGVRTPDWVSAGQARAGARLEPPYIVKSLWEDASVGLDDDSVIRDERDLGSEVALREARFGGEWFAEAFVEGREFNISVPEDGDGVRVLPPAEIVFSAFPPGKPTIVGYRAKWAADSFEYNNTPRTFDFPPGDAPLIERLTSDALRVWDVLGLRGYARVDFRVDGAGTPLVLEVNANPCLSPDAGFVAAVLRAGLGYHEVASCILAAALRGSR
jgi:D-alanine-D-alanine ligase